MIPSSSNRLTVIFDGTCGFCTAIRRHIDRYDPDQRLAWVPCQAMPASAAEKPLCDRTVITITPDGSRNTGVQAFARIVATLTGSQWPVTSATLPVIRPLLALVYWGIARLRHRLPGDTPWCEQHPRECWPLA
jgi:predicted DCC family thiol-disulfide oxidoreductase YuxK